MDFSIILLLLWAGLVFWELGQIWLIQIVVYPVFAKVGAAQYVGYHSFYVQRIPAPVIVPGFASFLPRSGRPRHRADPGASAGASRWGRLWRARASLCR